MFIEMCYSKIGKATVTDANLHYEGSITIDDVLIKAAGLIPGQKVHVLNVNNGERFETYVIQGKAKSGSICLNGPAARLGVIGDKVVILSYVLADKKEAESIKTKIINVDEYNKIKN